MSIIQKNRNECFLCHRNGYADPLDKHHIFGGALRNKSEKYGLTVYLCHSSCHIFGCNAVHQNAEISNNLKMIAQQRCMEEYGWTVDRFRKEFRKNYL